MHYLIKIASSLDRSARRSRSIAPLLLSASRDILCLAEASGRMRTMNRLASTSNNVGEIRPAILPEVFDTLRNTNRSCVEILKSLESMESEETNDNTDMEVARAAVRRLALLADSLDSIRMHRKASEIDELISMAAA